ncbi:MAG: phage integrase family protein [SAR324 cluster bacterium]|nr:phage integrase family protein [SAR324 cluster bacterium]
MQIESIEYLTQKELKKLFQVIGKRSEEKYPYGLRDLTIFNIAYYCGLRVSEIGMLTRGNFNEQRDELFCRRLKGSRSNTLRLTPDKSRLLKKYIREYSIINGEQSLFKSRKGNPISKRQLQDLMAFYGKQAKLPEHKQHIHVLKHSIAVHLAQSGMDIKEVQYWLGHKNVENTMVYFQFTADQADTMYRKLQSNSKLV